MQKVDSLREDNDARDGLLEAAEQPAEDKADADSDSTESLSDSGKEAEEGANEEQPGPRKTVHIEEEDEEAKRGAHMLRRASRYLTKEARSKRQSLKVDRIQGQFLEVEDLVEEGSASAGNMIDFLVRCARTAGQKGKKGNTNACREHQRLMMILVQNKENDLNGYEFATQLVCREKLQNQLMEGITRENKDKGAWKKTGLEALRYWAKRLYKMKRERGCLAHEVECWLARWRMEHTSETQVAESIWDRKDRLEDFWSSFHDRARVLDAVLTPDQKHRPNIQRLSSKDTSSSMYGLSWDFDQSTHLKSGKTSMGETPSQRKHQQARGRAGSGIDDAGGRPLSAGQRFPGASGGMGSKSASLPSLQKELSSRSESDAFPTTRKKQGRAVEQLPPITAGRKRYLQECDRTKRAPMPLAFVTGHSKEFTAAGKDLVDSELLAMADMLQEMECVEEVNLFDNSLLTDRGLVQFLKQLMRDPVKATLQSLNLGRCLKAGPYALDTTVKLLKSGGCLQILNLSQVPITTRFQLPLCQAIGKHACLRDVNLEETGFRHHEMTTQCLTALLSSRSVRELNIGWNCFNGEVFKHLGGLVVNNSTIKSISVANCAATSDTCAALDFVPPLSRFLERLSHDKTLTKLDISMNRCDFRTALILEDSLDTHKHLRELVMTHNPLGVIGMRNILRLLSRDHTGLMMFDTDGCYVGETNEGGGFNSQIFSYTNPGGKYNLELWRPYHRALLRMLYKKAEMFKLQPDEAFEKCQYYPKAPFPTATKQGNPQKWDHATKDHIGVWQVPEEGLLSCVFSIEQVIFKRFMCSGSPTAIEDSDYAGFLDQYMKEMRFRPGFKKVIPLFARWKELDGHPLEQTVYINSLSKDFNMTLPYLEHMCAYSKTMLNDIVWRLIASISADMASRYLAGLIFPKLGDFTWTYNKMKALLEFNQANPTGHYHLDLSNCSSYAVAERCLLLDRWEAAVDRKHGRKDISHRGNLSHIRNEVFQGKSLHTDCHSIAEWKLSEHGILEFDYISNNRPKADAKVPSDELWRTILLEMYQSICTPEDKIMVLRSLSHHFYLRSKHMRAMIGFFKTEQQRADVFIIFYLRIIDMHNAKMFRVRFENHREVRSLQGRLGYASFFPFLQPENAKFDLDLSVHDQRLCASIFVQLAIKEGKNLHNIHEYHYYTPTGSEVFLTTGIPKSWGEMKTIPQEGRFIGTYMCAPEHRNFAHRKDIAITYGYHNCHNLDEKYVKYWTGLTEPPEDVINLLEYFISRYDNVAQPFRAIDGPDGNGEITRKEFFEGLEQIGCKKFDAVKGKKKKAPGAPAGPVKTKDQRLDAIFRYLDPGGEGSVSKEEWNILDQLWKEFALSIREFVQFLTLTFGEDLNEAWAALDEDESGEMDEGEFLKAVEAISYFGPAGVVFALIDSSDDGKISADEFMVLEKYKKDESDSEDEK